MFEASNKQPHSTAVQQLKCLPLEGKVATEGCRMRWNIMSDLQATPHQSHIRSTASPQGEALKEAQKKKHQYIMHRERIKNE